MIQKVRAFLFKNQTTRQTVVKNTIWLSVSNIGGRLLRSFIVIYAARVLGVAGWGAFSYGITIIGILSTLTDIGVNSILIRESVTADNVERRGQIISTSFFIKLALLVFNILILLFVLPRIIPIEAVRPLLPAVALIFFFDTLRAFASYIFYSLERSELETLSFLTTNTGVLLFGFLFLLFHPTAKSFAYAYAVGTGVGVLMSLWLLRGHVTNLFAGFSKNLVGYILWAAWPIAISGVMTNLLINTDILFLGWFRGAVEVGYYAAANRILQILYLTPSIIAVTTIPLFSRLAIREPEKFRNALELLLRALLLVALPLVAGGMLVGGRVLVFIFGYEYAPAGFPFQILILTLLSGFMSGVLVNAVFAHKRQKNLTIYSILAGVSNVAFDLILIPRFGMTGSSFATLASEIISAYYLWHIMQRIQPFTLIPHLSNIGIATGVMAMVTYALVVVHTPLVLILLVAAALYFSVLYLRREPVLKEVRSIFAPSLE